MSTEVVSVSQIYSIDFTFDHPNQYLAQGDSWFSLGGMTSNILQEIRLDPPDTRIINCARPGKQLRKMLDWLREDAFLALLDGRYDVRWQALLLSAGGNDLIAAAQVPGHDEKGALIPQNKRLLLMEDEWGSGADANRYVSLPGYDTLEGYLLERFNALMGLLNDPACPSQGAPVFLHAYDYPLPVNQAGNWLGPALAACKIPQMDWNGVAGCLIDLLAGTLQTAAARYGAQVKLVDTRGTLPLRSGAWANEIHPSRSSYVALAEKYAAAVLKKPAPPAAGVVPAAASLSLKPAAGRQPH